MTARESFDEFRSRHDEEVKAIASFLSEGLPDDFEMMCGKAKHAVALYSRCVNLAAWAMSFYKQSCFEALISRENVTELDRKVRMEAETAPQRRYREILEGYTFALDRMISLSQTLIKATGNERNKTQ
ncbi:MAG: hypothetical protein QME66_05900 [Candidatus Eisenbacteria bacterium]|nr:hypothetical protein [Candidatus Eisenbacteria bacterium]